MQNLAVGGYTKEEVMRQLNYNKGGRKVSFRYELLDNDDMYIADVESVTGTISYNSYAEIKRTAGFSIKCSTTDGKFLLNKRLRPYYQLTMPTGEIIEWSLGIFLLSSPVKSDLAADLNTLEIMAFDKAQILKEDKFTDRKVFLPNTNYVQNIIWILDSAGITNVNIAADPSTLTNSIEFEVGYSKLSAINDLLTAINYYSLSFDEEGYAYSRPYILPANREVDYVYRTDNSSVIKNGAKHKFDQFNIPNVFVRVLSRPERYLKSIYVNNDADSPISTVNRGYNIVDFDTVDDIANQAALDQLTVRQATEMSQVFGEVELVTAIMPHHSFLDCLYIEHKGLLIDDVFVESQWEMRLDSQADMKHMCRKVVGLW